MPTCPTTSQPLGTPLPDTTHAVSVSLPTWADVVGYEEGEARVHGSLQAGYPRFVFHPIVQEVITQAEHALCQPGEKCLVFPSARSAELCGEFLGTHCAVFGLLSPEEAELGAIAPHALVFPESSFPQAKAFWQHSGYILSSRQAEDLLAGRNPASAEEAYTLLQQRLAEASGAQEEDIFLFPGGMAAIFTAYQAVRSFAPEKRTLQLGFPYVDTLKIQEKFQDSDPLFIPDAAANDFTALEEILKSGDVGAVFCEFPTNPLLTPIDLAPLYALLHRYGALLVVDDTIASCYNADCLPYADILTTSLTKSFSGGGDVLGGSAMLNKQSPYYTKLKDKLLNYYENIFYAADVRVLEQNSRDVKARIQRSKANTEALCDALHNHPAVARLYYPKFTAPDIYNKYKKADGGYGCLFSLVLKDPEVAPRFFDTLDIPKGPSFGNRFSLVCPYTIIAHYHELPQVNAQGVASHLIRVSVGEEPIEELKEKFLKALG